MRTVIRRGRVSLVCAGLVGATILTVAPPAPAAESPQASTAGSAHVFTPAADARTAKQKPTVNFGTTPTIDVDGSPDVESYLRFSVSGLAGDVRQATLRLWVVDKSANGPAVYPSRNGWTETGITWKNRPARTGPKTADLKAVAKNTWVELDVTRAVTGDGDWSFALAGPSADAAVFSSREGANPPQLVVTTGETPPPPPTTTTTTAPPTTTTTVPPSTTTTTSTSPPVTTPPDTTIDAAWIEGVTARFGFSATTAGSTFECRLDGAGFAPCTAPVTYDRLALGDHTFAVRATDGAGHTDPSPAQSRFTIAPGSIRDALLAPAAGAEFGFYAHPPAYDQASEQAAVTDLEAALGRKADIDHWYEPWGDSFPGWRQPWDVANGRIPMISWGKESTATILSGADDAYITARADGVRAFGKPVFLRWFWEMDGNKNLGLSGSPAAYIAAWRHIHDIFTARGATNVAWVWCPNASSFKTGSAQRYYPGDDVVDWICADGYNFSPDASYREFAPIFSSFYAWASQRPKPLMIGEYGDMQAAPGQRAAWIDAAHAALEEQFPRILAAVYFHSNDLHDWTFEAEPDALDAMRRMAQDPYFNHSQMPMIAIAGSLG